MQQKAEVIDFMAKRNSTVPKTGVSSTVASLIERPFSGADLMGAFISNYESLLKQDGVNIESFLRFDMRNQGNYNMILTGIFDIVVHFIFKPCDVTIKEILPHKNQIFLQGPDGKIYIASIQLPIRKEKNNSTEDIFTDIEVFLEIEGEQVRIAQISKGEICRTF